MYGCMFDDSLTISENGFNNIDEILKIEVFLLKKLIAPEDIHGKTR